MSQTQEKEFGKWRAMLWPIHGYELAKLIPMALMMFFINFNYTVLRDTKDTLVVTGAGAHVIPFLKVWCVLPSAVVFMLIYQKLANKLSREGLFYATICPFLVFFAIFGLVLYPLRESLHPLALANSAEAAFDSMGLQGLVGIIDVWRNWTFSLFYVMAELWGSVVLSLLFWGFANHIGRVYEAKRFYAVYVMICNIAMLIAGPIIVWFSGMPEFADTVLYLSAFVTIATLSTVALYWWVNNKVLTDPRFFDPNEKKAAKKKKPKMGMGESLLYLAKSKYLLCLVIMVIGYGMAINMVEVPWKAKLRQQFPVDSDYQSFMGSFSFMTGLVTIFMCMFIGGNVVRRFGWGIGALVTPVVLMVTGMLFFGFVVFDDAMAGLMMMAQNEVLWFAVIFGAAQNIMSKSTKYSLFDPTKEMAYIPLDEESKVKGKAAIDVVGARLGKSGGSFVIMGLLAVFQTKTVMPIIPYLGAAVLVIIAVWIVAARALNKMFLVKNAEMEERLAQAAAAENVEAKVEAPAVEPAAAKAS